MGAYPVKFGKYLLLERVNVGGMAEVFKAKTFGVAGFERILAIKRILPSLVEDDEFIRMFIDEARIAVQLNHANIVQIYELGKHGDHYYIAMEYLPSRDLRTILDRMRAGGQLMPIPQAAHITSKVCEGLDYAHRRRDPSGQPMNIIHRDVSPQNVLITYEGEIKVIDFGIAKAANRASKTQAGVLKGKFGYMSPEQVRGLPIDRRSDIFAVGVLLYEMLTGERLFIGESDFSTLERVRNAEVIPPTTFNKKVTPELEHIVLKALAREQEDRYAWASDLAEDLQPFLIEDRSIYNAKRLAAYMKETYNPEIASERQKMEDYLRVTIDDAHSDRNAAAIQEEVKDLPSPRVEVRPSSSLASQEALPGDGIDFNVDDEEDEREDKTFVIEASEAGQALEPGADSMGDGYAVDPSARPPRIPDAGTNDDFLSQASLYGDDESDLEDDAATMVSAANPFDEVNGPATDEEDDVGAPTAAGAPPSVMPPSMVDSQTNPSLSSLGATHEESLERSASQLSASTDPIAAPAGSATAPSTSGPAMPAMDVSASGPTARAPRHPGGNGASAPGLPAPALPVDALAPDDETERADGQAIPVPPQRQRMSTGMMAALFGGVALTFLIAVGVVGFVVWQLTSAKEAMVLLTPPPGVVAQDVKIFVDGELVAQELPTQVAIESAPGHSLRVDAAGFEPLEMPLPVFESDQVTSLPLPLRARGGAEPGEDEEPAEDDKPAEDEKPVEDKKPAQDDKPVEDKKPAEDEKPAADEKPAEDEKPAADNEPAEDAPATDEPAAEEPGVAQADGEKPAVAVAAGSTWRVSFTAVSAGASVHGAKVYRDGALVGVTPFEAEVSAATDKLKLEVFAEGYATKAVEIARAGRDHVGPAAVALVRPLDGETPEPPGPTASEKKDGEEPAGDPAEKADQEKPAAEEKVAKAAEPEEKKPASTASDSSAPPSSGSSSQSGSATSSATATKRPSKPRVKRVELALGTRPIAHVVVNGRKTSLTTPLMGPRALKLRPGDHRIDLIDARTNKKYRYRVTLPPDSPKNRLIIILGKSIRVREGKATARQLK